MIIAIDPGPVKSGFCTAEDDWSDLSASIMDNYDLRSLLVWERVGHGNEILCVEMIASYGMPVGQEVFETCVWIGRFIEAWAGRHRLIYRKDVKMHLCGSPKAKDTNIRQALIDKFGEPGTKKSPGATYGIKKDMWAALAVAVTAKETQ